MTIKELRTQIVDLLAPLAWPETSKPMTEIYEYTPPKWDNPPFMIVQYTNTENETEDSCSNNVTFNFNLSVVHIINSVITYWTAEEAICSIIDQVVELLNDNRTRWDEAISMTGPTAELRQVAVSDKGSALVWVISLWVKFQDVLA